MISADTAYGAGRVLNIIKLIKSCLEQGAQPTADHLGVSKILVARSSTDLTAVAQEIRSDLSVRVLEFGLNTGVGCVKILGKSDCEAVLKTNLTEPRVFAILRN